MIRVPRKSKANRQRSARLKRYWRYMGFLQNKFTGSTDKAIANRANAKKFTNIKLSTTPNIKQIRKLHTRIKLTKKKMRAKARKEILELEGPEFADVVNIDEFVDEFIDDSLFGDFLKEVHET